MEGRCASRTGVEPGNTFPKRGRRSRVSAGYGHGWTGGFWGQGWWWWILWSILEGSIAEGRCWWVHAPDQQHWTKWWIKAGLILSRPVTYWPLLCIAMVERGRECEQAKAQTGFICLGNHCNYLGGMWSSAYVICLSFCQVVCRSLDVICCSCFF